MACNHRVGVVVGVIINTAGDDHEALFYFCKDIRNFVLPGELRTRRDVTP
jgi:hypothetical protein